MKCSRISIFENRTFLSEVLEAVVSSDEDVRQVSMQSSLLPFKVTEAVLKSPGEEDMESSSLALLTSVDVDDDVDPPLPVSQSAAEESDIEEKNELELPNGSMIIEPVLSESPSTVVFVVLRVVEWVEGAFFSTTTSAAVPVDAGDVAADEVFE